MKYNRELLLGLHLCTAVPPQSGLGKNTPCICTKHPQPLLSRSFVCDFMVVGGYTKHPQPLISRSFVCDVMVVGGWAQVALPKMYVISRLP